MKSLLKKKIRELNELPEIQQILKNLQQELNLRQDENIVLDLKIQRLSQRKRYSKIVEEKLTQPQWESLFSKEIWKPEEMIILENFREAQKHGVLWISNIDALGDVADVMIRSIDLHYLFHGLVVSIRRKLKDENLSFNIRKRQRDAKYGLFSTRPILVYKSK